MSQYIRRLFNFPLTRKARRDEPTSESTTPQAGRKRRLSMTDQEEESQERLSVKKAKGDQSSLAGDASDASAGDDSLPPPKGKETDGGVKEVTKGVKEVDLEDRVAEGAPSSSQGSSAVPIPEAPKETDDDKEEDRESEKSTPGEGSRGPTEVEEPAPAELVSPPSDEGADRDADEVPRNNSGSKNTPRALPPPTGDAPAEIDPEERASSD